MGYKRPRKHKRKTRRSNKISAGDFSQRETRFEQLEDRMLLAADLADGTLLVTGTEAGDDFLIRAMANNSDSLEVFVNGVREFEGLKESLVGGVQVNGLNGIDRLVVDFGQGDPVPPGGIFYQGGIPIGGDALGDMLDILPSAGASIDYQADPSDRNAGLFLIGGTALISFDGVERTQLGSTDYLRPDAFEANDSLATATALGPATTLGDLTIHDIGDGASNDDYFQVTAPETGLLSVSALFVNAAGDLGLEILDSRGFVIASSRSSTDDERLVVPAVAEETYFVRVFGENGATNAYALETTSATVAAPQSVHLDPRDDTGMMNNDAITANAQPRILVQADVNDFRAQGIPILTAAEAASGNVSGAAVVVFVTDTLIGDTEMGFADPVDDADNLFEYDSPGLPTNSYLVTAAVQIFDLGRTFGGEEGSVPNPATGRSLLAPAFELQIDLQAPLLTSPQMLPSSDSGMDSLDRVTNIIQPAFRGEAEPNAKVRVFANGFVVGEGVAGSDARWEITVEPLVDGIYATSAQAEDLAGNFSESDARLIEIDTIAPNTPFLDLVDASDTGLSGTDDLTSETALTFTMTTSDSNSRDHLSPFNFKYRLYVRPEGGEEFLIYNSVEDESIAANSQDGFTDLGFLTTTLPELPSGTHNFKLEVEDRAGNISEDFLLSVTIDTEHPNLQPTIDLLQASDSGMSDTDNVTNIREPAFQGLGEVGARVSLYARKAGSEQIELVGIATVGSDLSDMTPGDGLGAWEITSEPLADGVYNFTAQMEDSAGNVNRSPELTVEVDTLAPNTPFLDLREADDSGRSNDDNVTNAPSLRFSATTEDPNSGDHLILFPAGQNLKYRVFVRPESGTEQLIYDSAADGTLPGLLDGLTAANLIETPPVALPEGLFNVKLEVEDRAGNISPDFLLNVLVDRTAFLGTVSIHPDNDTGIWGIDSTFGDGITGDSAPTLVGTAEANNIVALSVNGQPAGTTVALPYDGDDAFQPPNTPNQNAAGNWQLTVPVAISSGSLIEATFEDLAGNRATATTESEEISLVIDTIGPRITNVTRDDEGLTSLFDLKPAGGPDPLLNSIVVHFEDGPARPAGVLYGAVLPQLAMEEGNYRLVGDANGNMPIVDVSIIDENTGPGIATTAVRLTFAVPLPDDRFTLTVSDRIADAAGNPLDGESGAAAPFVGNAGLTPTQPIFPTGDGNHGGDFTGRFTIDSRPELGVWAAGNVWVDTNGNFTFDPTNIDYVNRDIVYKIGFTSDDIFAGNFSDGEVNDGFDRLAAYGPINWQYRWIIDLDNDGAPDINVADPANVNGIPVAGRFDDSDDNGDEVGVFTGTVWHFDTDHDFQVDLRLATTMRGYPIVGDFDGDGFDDLGTWADDEFQMDLANGVRNGWDGAADATFRFGYIGVRERPVAADMDQDGIDDVGLWTPDRTGVTPHSAGEWYWLVSGGNSLLDRIETALDPVRGQPEVDFTPIPFGPDIYARFGDEFALPIVGNFDPPSIPTRVPAVSAKLFTNPANPMDVNNDGFVTSRDVAFLISHINAHGAGSVDRLAADAMYLDPTGDGSISPRDVLAVVSYLNNANVLDQPAAVEDAVDAIALDVASALADDDEAVLLAESNTDD